RRDELVAIAGDDAVVRVDAEMAGEDGVVVCVLRMSAFQRQPATDVVPEEWRLHHQHVPGFLHDRVIDAGAVVSRDAGVLTGEPLVTLRRLPRGGDALDGGGERGPIGAQLAQDGRRTPDEDAAVPEMLARCEELLGQLDVWLLAKAGDAMDRDALPVREF